MEVDDLNFCGRCDSMSPMHVRPKVNPLQNTTFGSDELPSIHQDSKPTTSPHGASPGERGELRAVVLAVRLGGRGWFWV